MNGRLFIITGLALFSASCNKPSKTVPAPEAIFDSTGQQVITSSFNEKRVTMSVLYGNALARGTASAGKKEHVPGEVFTLVTWKKEPAPYWFGSDINGELQTIEQVHVSTAADSPNYDYTRVVKGAKDIPQEFAANKKDRIRFIIDQDASVFP